MTLEDIALTLTPGLGIKGVVHLLETFGDAQRVFAASTEELLHVARLREDAVRNLIARKGFSAAEKELNYCRHHHITAVASTDADYPPLLREIGDYPHILYVCGHVEALSGRCISMVGTRNLTTYGADVCQALVAGLSARVPELVIVSGLAFGGDAACHRAAVSCGVPTVGVLANALPEVTPAQHTALAREMIEQGGALVSELHANARQNGNFYAARNRIIAALSAGTIVVESAAEGGSLLTAKYADGYGRTVLAIPGRVDAKYSVGTNLLIRNRVAQLILSAEDVIRELMWDLDLQDVGPRPQASSAELIPAEAALLAHFKTEEPLTMNELANLSGLDVGALSALLVGLELAGVIRQMPGNTYRKR
ncbi:MAG: DNA-processing protein DprA [Alistipes sp.]